MANPLLTEGQKFPDFSLPNQDGKTLKLADFAGRWLVVYIYPKDDTPGCTIQGKSFTATKADFDTAGITVLGLSADDVASHKSFCTKFAFNIDLLADPQAKLLAAAGVTQSEYKGTLYWDRTTFVIDPKGVVRKVYTKVKPDGHEQILLNDIRALRGSPIHVFTNLAFYKFVDLPEAALPMLRNELLGLCSRLDLKGTILLAPEGLNAFVAGRREALEGAGGLKEFFATHAFFSAVAASFPYKESPSDHQPFNRMLVRLKKEIISMGRPDVSPARFTGPRVAPRELKEWLDGGRELVLLDTRNDYEVRLGTFENAVDLGLETFRQFPERARAAADGLRGKTVVSFCTGGIRCEKASAFLLDQGLTDVYQLDGGILRYLEEVGGAHYRGECFVFDSRVAVDAALRETGAVLCYGCQNPVTVEEQKEPEYVVSVSCPHCFGQPKKHKERIAAELTAARA